MTLTKFWVSMTDKFLSGWGMAENKISKHIYECESYEIAEIVEQNAKNRGDQKYISICINCPRYDSKRYLVRYHTIADSANWYKKGMW